jgi:PTH2 family peptidyl-tRNA hydrolase
MAFLTEGAQKGFIKFLFNAIKIWLHKPSREWLKSSFAKICVRVDSEKELMDIYNLALSKNIKAKLIVDSGRTEFNGVPTPTSVAIGPDVAEKVDEITANLELY